MKKLNQSKQEQNTLYSDLMKSPVLEKVDQLDDYMEHVARKVDQNQEVCENSINKIKENLERVRSEIYTESVNSIYLKEDLEIQMLQAIGILCLFTGLSILISFIL